MKKFSTHFSESYLAEDKGSMKNAGDIFKRQNKKTFLDKAGKGELLSTSGEKLPIKDKEVWKTVKSDIQKATDQSDLPSDFTNRLRKAIAPMSKLAKAANGLSTQSGKDPSGEDWEAVITVALDKLAGRKFMESPEWERFGKVKIE